SETVLGNQSRRPMMFPGPVIAHGSPRRPWCAWAFVFLLFLGAGGCGGGPTLYPVSGKVSYKDGKPVTAGLGIFEPAGQKISARGEIQSDGSFQLGTYKNNDGALEGEYKVLIAPPPLPEEGKPRRPAIHAKYQSLESTPLKFTVTPDRDKN